MTEDVAIARFEQWQSVDPFPSIKPALLNSADIADYALATGMIWPFYPDKLKSAAYEMLLGNEILYWDENGDKVHSVLDNNSTTFKLKRNSITYVTLKETFQLPDYIAVRFNLTVSVAASRPPTTSVPTLQWTCLGCWWRGVTVLKSTGM